MAEEIKRTTRSSTSVDNTTGRTRAQRAKAVEIKPADVVAESSVAAAPTVETPEAARVHESSAPTHTAPTQNGPTHTAPAHAAPAHAAPATAAASGSGGVAIAGLIAGLAGIVLALTYPQWTPIVYGGTGSGSAVTAEQVRKELGGEITGLKSTIAALNQKLTATEQALQTAKLPGILMVAEDLRSELGGSAPYAGTLNLFRALAGDDPAATSIVSAVQGGAEHGVPSLPDLRRQFDEAVHAVLTAEQRPEARSDLAAQVSDTVASLAAATMRLRWRIDGAPAGDGIEAVVARAEQAVMAGELQTAIDTLALLPDARRELTLPWIENARARLAADAVREELDAYIITTAARIQ